MKLDIRVRIDEERQANKLRLHPLDSGGQGNDRVRSTS